MTTDDVQFHGSVAAGYEAVKEAFAENFRQDRELGAAVAVYRDGALVVDLWGGHKDPARQQPWGRETATTVYSVTKGATATLFNMLHQSGEIDLDRPVADYWPEFGRNGKQDITIRTLLSHRAGLPALDETLTREQLIAGAPAAEALARQVPLWPPGTAQGYHALTFGWLTGELIRRATGTSLGTLFAERIAGPLGLTFWIGAPYSEGLDFAPLVDGVADPDELARVTDPQVRAAVERLYAALQDPTSLFSRVLSTNGALPTPHAETWNDPRVIRAEQPGANGVTNARSLARLYAATVAPVDGVRLLSDATLAEARAERAFGPDTVTMGISRFGTGYQLAHAQSPLLGETSFGHAGAGGALGFGDAEARVGFGYTQNRLGGSMINERRAADLVAALKSVIAA